MEIPRETCNRGRAGPPACAIITGGGRPVTCNFWKEIADRAAGSGAAVVMVIGGSDTGKTTLVERLAGRFAGEGPTAVVDLDMGQSHVGPPTTVAWARVGGAGEGGGFPGWNGLTPDGVYFTGATSPVGSLLPSVARLVEVDLEEAAFEFTRDRPATDRGITGRAASLRDERGRDIAVGIVEKAELDQGRVAVRAPLPEGAVFTTLVVGAYQSGQAGGQGG